jgi:hypothetical protein
MSPPRSIVNESEAEQSGRDPRDEVKLLAACGVELPKEVPRTKLVVDLKITGGNADVDENRGVEKKAIRKCMKTRGVANRWIAGAIRKYMKARD